MPHAENMPDDSESFWTPGTSEHGCSGTETSRGQATSALRRDRDV